jgi:DnaJ-domain-containing protein 1
MEIMEKREALGDARRARDLDALRRLGAEVREREAATTRALAADFSANGEAPERVVKRLGELRYYRRFLDEAAAIEDDLS